MSEKEKQILEDLTKTIEKLPELKKQYFLGYAEGVAAMAEPRKEDRKEEPK